ncbi:hypothetical protein [Nocardia sp. Marseille-Q1738]
MISFAVVAHQARLVQATELAHSIGAIISLDDGSIGADNNHLRAWADTTTIESEWAAVLEDDAEPVAGFIHQAERALAVAPAPVVSFYVGTGRPMKWQDSIAKAITAADRVDAHWLTCNYLLHAVAVAIRTDLVDDWLGWAHSSRRPIDERMSAWCLTRHHRVAYTAPSLVDHADGPTLISPHPLRRGDKPRRAWRTGTRDTWNTTSVDLC